MLEADLLKYQKLINDELKRFINNHFTNYTSNWNDVFNKKISDFLLSGGKRLRPVLAYLIYEGTGGRDLSSAVKISLATEILHNSTLIHDDIIDASDIRRGKGAFHKVFEKWFIENDIEHAEKEAEAMAILAGDYLIFLAFQSILDSGFPDHKKLYVIKIIRDISEIVIKGQIIDNELVKSIPTQKDYIKLIEMKTASLFEGAINIATVLSDARPDVADNLSKYAKAIGCAFQIHDDILGMFGKEKELGKSLTSDLSDGKKTILIIKAYENASSSQKEILNSLVGNKNVTQNDVEKVKEIIKATGSLDYAKALADKYANESVDIINAIKESIKGETYAILHELPEFITNRKY